MILTAVRFACPSPAIAGSLVNENPTSMASQDSVPISCLPDSHEGTLGAEQDECHQADRAGSRSTDSLTHAVEHNSDLLGHLLEQFTSLQEHILADAVPAENVGEGERQELAAQVDKCRQYIDECERQIADLEQQNKDLASQVANSSVRQTVACTDSGTSDALSWEDRKQLIIQQMEDESFDDERFVGQVEAAEPIDPIQFVEQLNEEFERTREELNRRDEEVGELRCLLQQQSETRENGTAIGAAAIAGMIDTDELVQEERARLQQLQEEWEEKFRKGEIEASLERAKLSRERMELARKNSELEERLEHLERENRHVEQSGPSSRRWLAKLGLSDE